MRKLSYADVGLTEFEYRRAVARLGREPAEVELGMLGALWSEHCAYKHSRPLLRLLPTSGERVVVGPGENAGAVDLGGGLAAVFKVESHNHPSAVEPFQGAATGVGGIVRDVFAMGARPVALLNALFFGDPAKPRTRRYVEGVVGGIASYGNCLGIPDVGGHVTFHPAYDENPLVNAMCVGIVPTEKLTRALGARAGDAVYLVGADTGRDGIAGASLLASFELGDHPDRAFGPAWGPREAPKGPSGVGPWGPRSPEGASGVGPWGPRSPEGASGVGLGASGYADQEKRPSVQVGDPFLEKLLMEACLELVEGDHLAAMQDLGAAGLACAVSEVAAKGRCGMEIDVRKVPRRAQGMSPYEVMLSESQERMLVVPKRGHEAEVERISARWGLHCTRIGEVVANDIVRVRDADAVVAEAPATLLAEGAPTYELEWARDEERAAWAWAPPRGASPDRVLLAFLSAPNVASRERIYRRYDQMVGVDTVLGPGGDAGVLRLKGRRDGIALTIDANPELAARDPYLGAAATVAEAARNLVCVGARPLGLTDCLNLGNPERPRGAWQLRRTVEGLAAAASALGLPFVSGNVSLYNARSRSAAGPQDRSGGDEALSERSDYNASAGRDIVPTPVVGAVGQLDDVALAIRPGIGNDGDHLVLLGSAAFGDPAAQPRRVALGSGDEVASAAWLAAEARLHAAVLDAHAAGLVTAAHDLGEGGLAVALAEMAIRGRRGAVLRTGEAPFASGHGRILVAATDAVAVAEVAARHGVDWRIVGVVGGERVVIDNVLDVPVEECARAYREGLALALGLER